MGAEEARGTVEAVSDGVEAKEAAVEEDTGTATASQERAEAAAQEPEKQTDGKEEPAGSTQRPRRLTKKSSVPQESAEAGSREPENDTLRSEAPQVETAEEAVPGAESV